MFRYVRFTQHVLPRQHFFVPLSSKHMSTRGRQLKNQGSSHTCASMAGFQSES